MLNRLHPIFVGSILSIFVLVASTALLLGPASAQAVTEEIETSTQAVIADQLDAFQQNDHERAFSHAAPTIRQVFKTKDNFIRMVKTGYGVLYDPDQYIFGRNFNVDGTIHQEVIATDEKGKQWQAIYTLKQQEDGSWKITGVKMEPYQGAAT
ncbi:MAG: DUF4864 domain-containing protein [Rhizobiaceae bacterium]|nr:DUF4864 domain-containing protein [Rhizobiaceae bacterium]